MAAIALTLFILWVFSLWLFLIERQPLGRPLPQAPFTLAGGTVLFFVLSLAGLLFLRLLLSE